MANQAPAERRILRFSQLSEILSEADQLAAAEAAGRLQLIGNWQLGQIFHHLATWTDYAFEKNPLKVPWVLRQMVRPLKNRILNSPMAPGRKIPGVAGGTLATETVATAEGLLHLHKATTRLIENVPTKPNAMLGALTHEEWQKLMLRHAELHLSFANTI